MKKLIIVLLVLINVSLCYSQGSTLTKNETVAYIKKKVGETYGYKTGSNYIHTASVELDGTQCDFSFVLSNLPASNYNEWEYTKYHKHFYFNPISIIKIENLVSEDAAIGYLRLYLNSKTVRQSSYSQYWKEVGYYKRFEAHGEVVQREYDYVDIPYVKSDPSNFDKLQKAFNHLITLLKAEDDPFGN